MTQGTRASHGIDALEAAEWCRINIWRQKEELPLNIKNPLADELARRLSRKTGHSITDVVIDALREQLRREEGRIAAPALAEQLLEVGRHCASLPDLDSRSEAEILGYDERGLWS